jgi:hypothetical protein
MGTSHSPHRSATGVTLHTRDRTPRRATEVLEDLGNMGRLECKLLDAPPARQLAELSTHLVKVGLRIEDRKLVKERKLRAIHERICQQVPMQRHVCPGGTF